MNPTEKEIQNQIIEYLNLKGHFVWRNSSGAFTNSKGGMYWFGQKGSPDIIGIEKGTGRFIGIEVKIKPNKPTVYQEAFLDKIQKNKGISIIAYSVDDVMRIL